MTQKTSSLDVLLTEGCVDDALANAKSNEARLQVLNRFLESVERFHETLKNSLFHRDELLGTMAEREIMEVARVNYKQNSIRFSGFNHLYSLDDQRLWLPPRIVKRKAREFATKRTASTNYYDRHLLVSEAEIDADIRDFDVSPDICSSDEVHLQSADIQCADDSVSSSSRLLRREFVVNALSLMSQMTEFIVSHNFSLTELPISLMHVVGRNLKVIDLSFNQLTELPYRLLIDFGAKTVAPAFPLLEKLAINNNRIGPFIPPLLFSGEFAPHLRSINLENNRVIGFTSLLLNALQRGTMVEFECTNNDFPNEDDELAIVVKSMRRAGECHVDLMRYLERFSDSVMTDITALRIPICFSALVALQTQSDQYFRWISEGRKAESEAMCIRCGVCDRNLFDSWVSFGEKYGRLTSTPNTEPSFFDDDASSESSLSECTLIDSALLYANACFWARKMADEQLIPHDASEGVPFASPPIPLYRRYDMLGQSGVPVLFYTCGAADCVDEVVDIVSGDSDGLIDYRKLTYPENHTMLCADSDFDDEAS